MYTKSSTQTRTTENTPNSRVVMIEKLKFFVYIIICFVCGTTPVSGSITNNNYFSGNSFKAINFGKAVSNAALHVDILKTVFVESEFHCQMACVLYKTCLSYNFGTISDETGFPCQLSGTDRYSGLLGFNETVHGYIHRGVKSLCDNESFCAEDKICIVVYKNNGAKCIPPWLPVGGSSLQLSQIDSGATGSVWGVTSTRHIYRLNTDRQGWIKVDGELKHVTAGKSGVWGVNTVNNIYYRAGLTRNNIGSSWSQIAGGLKQIDSGPLGVVYGINPHNRVHYRAGITNKNPTGTGWPNIEGILRYISCGPYACWGVNHGNMVFMRANVSPEILAGTGYIGFPGTSFKQIECGPNGAVWGVTTDNHVVYRSNVTAVNPKGSDWVKVSGRMVHVTVGCDGVYGLDTQQNAFIYMGKAFKKTPCV